MPTTNFGFTVLAGSDTAGYDSINNCIESIDTELNASTRLVPSTGGTSGYTITWNGTAWSAGQLNTAGIASGAITADKIASSIAIPGTPTIATPPTYSSGATGNSTVASTKYVTDAVAYATAGNVTLAGDVGGNASANTIGTGVVTSAKIADNTIVNGDINSSAAIAYSKLNLSNSIVAGDLTSKAVTYAKQGIVPSCKASKSTTTSISHATMTSISLNAEDWDTGVATGGTEFHSTSSNTSRITPSVAGVYVVSGFVSWDSASSTGMRGVVLNINGTSSISNTYAPAISGLDMYQTATGQVELNGTTDYVELRVYQNSGSALTLNAGPTLSVTWLGPLS